ncbi:MAG: hypothetical protein ABEL76_08605 [Bradymonadaceae bacterium]
MTRPVTLVEFAALWGLLAAGCSNGYAPGGPDASPDRADTGPADVREADGARSDSAGPADDAEGDANRDPDAGGGNDGQSQNGCTPNQNGTIERSEVPLEPGLRAMYRVASDVRVDTRGKTAGSGSRRWSFDESYDSQSTELVTFRDVSGQWYESEFPKAEYAAKLTGQSDALGLFRATRRSLLLLGVVSPDDEGATTEIDYDPSIRVLKFPLSKGDSWKTETTATGTHEVWSPFVPITWDETYKNQVDAAGKVETPYGTFRALRVRTTLERSASVTGVPLGTVRTFAFVAECFGTVATIRSERGEDSVEFDRASELRVLTK